VQRKTSLPPSILQNPCQNGTVVQQPDKVRGIKIIILKDMKFHESTVHFLPKRIKVIKQKYWF